MCKFDPEKPFPLYALEDYSYAEAKAHAVEADHWLGLEMTATEERVNSNGAYNPEDSEHSFMPEYWRGIPMQTLLTPYLEIRTILSQLDPQPDETIVDLGAAYGRMGFVVGQNYPGVHFVGYEAVRERVQEGRERLEAMGFRCSKMQEADLSAPDFQPIPAEYYFMYDFGSQKAIDKTLHDLGDVAMKKAITVVGRGYNTRKVIERQHPWLSELHRPDHYPGYSIYYGGNW